MAEYIERDALLKEQQMRADLFKGATLRTDIARRDEALIAASTIFNAPAADVAPVVRCKDCLSYDKANRLCTLFFHEMYEDDFCSRSAPRL